LPNVRGSLPLWEYHHRTGDSECAEVRFMQRRPELRQILPDQVFGIRHSSQSDSLAGRSQASDTAAALDDYSVGIQEEITLHYRY
jgi:hypothetical protein